MCFVNVPIGIAALVPARRVLAESRDAQGVLASDWWGGEVLALRVGTLALASVQGPGWGWADPRIAASFAAAAVLLACSCAAPTIRRRSSRRPASPWAGSVPATPQHPP